MKQERSLSKGLPREFSKSENTRKQQTGFLRQPTHAWHEGGADGPGGNRESTTAAIAKK